ncbi:helix-turn-helix domain-containing protein [Hansschlegelia quercus]|uniref:AraC family transcriptional regulator n=1 Tax=Hansschlegelia quercus TaxID=2528245 RepID=A0A4V2JDV9_9HYPH|nr:AraC family transcriptional regulator [Hansschlegelia quercus]TBN51794.1 AraC family transcriptional regulator [Hansschlegelia quercus]
MSAFRPRMMSTRQGISVVGAPQLHASESGLVEVWRARCEAGAIGDYVSLDPRIFIVLEPLEAAITLDSGEIGGRVGSSLRSASFVPAGAPVRLQASGATEVRHLDLHFDPGTLGPLDGLNETALGVPRLMFVDERVHRLARLLDAACTREAAESGLYGDALVAALVSAVFARSAEAPPRTALSDRQLRLSIAYIEERCADFIRLGDLAALTGLSPSYFSHAFKAATGMPPHRWQLRARVRRAKLMLAAADLPLTEIAAATGFADQPHFTRVFKEMTGRTPSAWRKLSR